MITALTLIGSHHYDQKGRKRLTKLLGYLRPEVISIEATEHTVQYMERREVEKKKPNYCLDLLVYADRIGASVKNIKRLLEVEGYEYYTARDYAKIKQIPVVLADPLLYQYVSSSKLIQTEVEQLVKLRTEDLEKIVRECYSSQIKLPESELAVFDKRDAETEKIIRSLTGRVVHIGGLLHVYAGNYNNLFKRLGDLSPQRMKLSTADKL